jgi:hypothetical protein
MNQIEEAIWTRDIILGVYVILVRAVSNNQDSRTRAKNRDIMQMISHIAQLSNQGLPIFGAGILNCLDLTFIFVLTQPVPRDFAEAFMTIEAVVLLIPYPLVF